MLKPATGLPLACIRQFFARLLLQESMPGESDLPQVEVVLCLPVVQE